MKQKLDPYKGIIDDRLRDFPKLSARRQLPLQVPRGSPHLCYRVA